MATPITTTGHIIIRDAPVRGTHALLSASAEPGDHASVRGRQADGVERLQRVHVHYYEADDSIFANGTYLIKGLAGRILWLLLTLYSTVGRSTFSNMELRRHPFLRLPALKNNLEARLLLLQRRLDDRAVAFRLRREQRGQLRVLCPVQLELKKIQALSV